MRLDSPRAIGLAGTGLVLAGWMLGSTLSPPVGRTQTRVPPRPVGADDAAVIVPLRDLGSRVPRTPPPAPARNPFVFGSTAKSAAAAPARAGAAPDTAAARPPSAGDEAAESWRLIGMATAADGTLTAVLGRSGTVVLARTGDVLPGGVTVTAVRGDAVQLTGADGALIDLRLP